MLVSHEVAVLLTLSYVDQFGFSLNKKEIAQRLIKHELDESVVQKKLLSLQRLGLVQRRGEWWKLSCGATKFETRLKRMHYSRQKWLEVDQLLRAIGWMPWIKGVAITGSLAMNNVAITGDVDVMVVTAAQRLWLVRLMMVVTVWWVGKRRSWRGHGVSNWCFNLWLDEEQLSLPISKRSLYSAYEICQAQWVLDRDGIAQKFLQANLWVKKLLPNFYQSPSQVEDMAEVARGGKFSQWLKGLNFGLFKLQYLYMYPHLSREKVSLGSAYFHPRDTKGQIYRGWFNSLRSLKKNRPRVVLVTGVFDLFHQEHRNFLRQAKKEGDLLVVGVESDWRVKMLKGKNRPVNNQWQRLQQVQFFSAVDLAFVLPEKFTTSSDHLALLKKINPQVLAVSSHTPHLREKRRLMKRVGGEVKVVHEQNPAVSTTRLVAAKMYRF